jgi:hypothetical protein
LLGKGLFDVLHPLLGQGPDQGLAQLEFDAALLYLKVDLAQTLLVDAVGGCDEVARRFGLA